MKLKIKSVLKTSDKKIDCFDEQQIIIKLGNTLCIKEIGKNEAEFICLTPQLTYLYDFKPSTNRKGVFTIQKIQNNVQVAQYSLRGTRKSIVLSLDSQFINDIEKVDMLVDEYDNNLLFGGIQSKEAACIFLVDIAKNKVFALGFINSYEDIKIDFRQNLTLSILCNNGTNNILKSLRYVSSQWEISQEPFKKINQGNFAHHHELLPCGRVAFGAKNGLYHFEGTELLQVIEMRDGEKIKDILKVHRGLLLIGQRGAVEVLIEDSDEVTLLSKGTIRLNMQQQDSINKVFLSHSGDEVILTTKKRDIYVWKCQYIDLQQNHFDFAFIKVQSSCSTSHEGTISLSTGRKYCMLAGQRNVTLWSVQKNEYVLSSQFISSLELQNKKSVLCCAINPDGNSFMLAFDDKVRVYRILLTKFKLCAEFNIKKCINIIYSHGGQLVACRFGKGLNSCIKIINNLRMVEVGQLKVQAEPRQIIWNQLDDQILVSTDTNAVQVFSVAQSTRTGMHNCSQKINHLRIDYKSRRIMISCDNKVIVANHSQVIEQYSPPFEDFHYIFPLYGIYFIVTKKGMLHWSPSYHFQSYNSYPLFTGKPFSLLCRSGYLLAYSSFQDILILYCNREGKSKNQVEGDDIVMVQRDEITEFYERIKMLQNNFEMLQSATQIKLEQQKSNYENAVRQFKSQFKGEIKQVSTNLNDMVSHKLKQEKETQKVFQQLEEGQLKNVGTIENMYERKCKILQEKLLNLQQSHLEQKQHYQKLLMKLQDKYHGDISSIRNRFQQKMRQEYSRADEVKQNVLDDKKRLQFKLVELEQENQITLQNIQVNKDDIISKLKQRIQRLESQLEGQQIKKQTILIDHQRLLYQNQQQQRDFSSLTLKFQEGLNRIKLLQKQVNDKKESLEQKENAISQLAHQIGGLQKAKYVLSFRTHQIRKQLQPKEELVDRLKSQLEKVDQEYKQSKKKNFDLSQKLQKTTKLNETTKKQLFDMKQALKLKQTKHADLLNKLNFIVSEVREKEWGEKIRQLNKKCQHDRKFKNSTEKKQRDPSQELNRHLKHVELSLQQVAMSNEKILRGKDKDIARRMKQNSQLMLQINVKKKNQILLKKANQQLKEEKEMLQKQFDQNYQTKRNSTRAQTSNTKRRAVSRDELRSREKSFVINREGSKERQLRDLLKQRSRVDSTHKTLMYRDETRQKNAKFFHIARQLQSARNTIKVQQQMLQELNKQVFIDENQPN